MSRWRGIATLRASLDRLREAFAVSLCAFAVHAKGTMPPLDQTMELQDGDGAVAATYGAGPGATLAIRPDGHVGYRSAGFDAGAIGRYLAGVAGRS